MTAQNKSRLADYLMKIDNVIGVSGDESRVGDLLKAEMEGLYDKYIEDPLGNRIFIRNGKNPEKTVMFSAHMDEIGFIINYIEDEGFGRIFPVGYHDDRMVVNQDLVFVTDDGREVHGITGSKPAHIMNEEDHKNIIPIEELYVDFGTDNREETLALGIEPGNYGTFNRQGYFLNDGKYYTGKSVDDRSCVAIMIEVMQRIKDMDIEPNVCMVGTTQEEVGMRAGGPIGSRINPEIMFALDVTLTGGTPGIEKRQCSAEMGKGVAFKYFDWDAQLGMTGSNVPRKVTMHQKKIADKYNIPWQYEVITGGGTDAWSVAMSGEGVLTGGISLPQRYMHTAVGTVNMDDMEHMTNFIVKYLQDYVTL